MTDREGSEVRATEQTASDASLRAAIRLARRLGLKVLLKPHLDRLRLAGVRWPR